MILKETGMNHDMDMSSSAHTVYHTGNNEVLLFSSLVISTAPQLVGACIIFFLLTVAFEGLRFVITWMQLSSGIKPPQSTGSMVFMAVSQTGVYLIYMFLSYCLMIVFMIMNVWICLAIILGAGTGHLIFHFRPFSRLLMRRFHSREDNSSSTQESKSEMSTVYGSSEHDPITMNRTTKKM